MSKRLNEVQEVVKRLTKEYPQLSVRFLQYTNSVKNDEGALDSKTKKLIALAISVSRQCEWCTAFHAKEAMNEGATEAEMVEACSIAIILAGSPALMSMKILFDTVDDLKKNEKRV